MVNNKFFAHPNLGKPGKKILFLIQCLASHKKGLPVHEMKSPSVFEENETILSPAFAIGMSPSGFTSASSSPFFPYRKQLSIPRNSRLAPTGISTGNLMVTPLMVTDGWFTGVSTSGQRFDGTEQAGSAASRRYVIQPQREGLDCLIVHMLAVYTIGIAIGPAQLHHSFTFKFHQSEIAPPGEIEGNIMIPHSARRGVSCTELLQVQ